MTLRSKPLIYVCSDQQQSLSLQEVLYGIEEGIPYALTPPQQC